MRRIKSAGFVVLAIVLCSAMPSFAEGSSEQPMKAGKATVRLATWTAAANLPVWQEAVDVFQKKNPSVEMVIEHTPSSAFWDKLTVGYAGGTSPDVIYTPPHHAQRVGLQGMLLDLTPLIEKDGVDMSLINPSSEKPYRWDGKIWAVAIVNDTRYTIYNKTLFRDAGLADLPEVWDDDSFTIDAFLSISKKLTDPSKQTWGYVFEGNTSAARFTWLFGADYWDNQDRPTRAVMDSREGVTGLQFVQDLVYRHKVAPSTTENIGGSDPMFQTGKVGMIWAGYKSAAAVHKDIKDFEWGITTMAKGVQRISIVSPQAFAVVSKSKVPDAAWAFVKYSAFEEGQEILTRSTSMPTNLGIDFDKVSPLKPWQNKLLQDGLKSGRTEIPHPNVKPEMVTIINEEMDQLMAKTKSGEQVARDMASRINEIFAKQ
jgi:multiple sugar transport system substrate-binding protein